MRPKWIGGDERPPRLRSRKSAWGAEVSCTQVGTTMAHDCVPMLKGRNSGQPIQGAIVVGADMPPMPRAHNIKPVKAEPMGKPGEYKLRIMLDMHGEWAFKFRLAKPTN